jgi:YD repeat-containing protein
MKKSNFIFFIFVWTTGFLFVGSLQKLNAQSFIDELDKNASPNTLTQKERKNGWELLFDGEKIKEWRGYNIETVPDCWQVENGALKIMVKGGEENALGHRSTTEYDGQNHIVKTIDPRENPTDYEYDRNHNLINVTDALENMARYLYDGQFRKTDAYDPLDHRIHYDYDGEHHLTGTIVYPEDGKQIETNATYYTNGLTHTATDGKGTIDTMTYDAYGNVDTTQTGTQPVFDAVSDRPGGLLHHL